MASLWDAMHGGQAFYEPGRVFQSASSGSLGSQVALFLVTALFLLAIKRRYFSPISHIPGPAVASFSRLWHLRQVFSGKQNLRLIAQHDKHGKCRPRSAVSCRRSARRRWLRRSYSQATSSAWRTTKSASAIPTPSSQCS